ncbi:hypothetical protein AT302_07030 [Pandoraea norimbergensis]|uniref:Polysaccharide polymerase n=2 Tax=Pandoraea norimbergensis TaxID=93219 RepID=A0ABN4JF20_9BURK|nr:hypothetical protein AT302_07030 [Pandoraea norimbergensis]
MMGCFVLWRVLTRRFAHPADLAALSVLYYALPLSFVALVLRDDDGRVYLHRAASDPEIALQSLHYAILAVISLKCGQWIASTIGSGAVRHMFPLMPKDGRKARNFILLLMIVIVCGIGLYGPAFFAGYAVESTEGSAALGNAFIYSSIEFIGLTFGYVLLVKVAHKDRPISNVVWMAAIFLIVLALLRGKRLEVVSAFLPLALLSFGMSRWLTKPLSRLTLILSLAVVISLVASLRLGEAFNLPSLMFNLFSEGLFAGHSLPGIIEKIQMGSIDYEDGSRMLMGVLAVVPRFLWPEKDALLYAGNAALVGVSPLGATTMLAEVVLQGGALAVGLTYFVMGFVFQRFYVGIRYMASDVRERRLPLAAIGYLVCVAIFIPHFRDGIIPAMKISFQAVVYLAVLAGLQSSTWSWRLLRMRRVKPALVKESASSTQALIDRKTGQVLQ